MGQLTCALILAFFALKSGPARAGEGGNLELTTPPEAPLAAIEVQGNHRVEAGAVESKMRSKVGQPLSLGDLQVDLQTLYGLGYFDDVQLFLKANDDGAPILVVAVSEKPTVRELRFEGLNELSKDDVDELVEVKTFSTLNPDALSRTERAIESKYREKGYFLAKVTHKIETIPDTASIDVVLVIDENKKIQVKEIRFVGNQHISDTELKSVMETREGGYFSFLTSSGTYQDEAFDRDLMRLSGMYYDRGYINVQVAKPQLALSTDRRSLYVTVGIEEGEPYRIGKLAVSGELLEPQREVLKRMKEAPGELFVRSKLGEDILALQAGYRDQGYAYVQVTPLTRVDPEAKTIDLDLSVSRGPLVFIERIEIKGHTRTRDKVIRREMRIAEGEQYDGTKIALSQQRVQALGYFENVEIASKQGSEADKIILEFDVKERPTGTFQVGAGVSSGEGLLVTAQIAHDNLFGRGQSLSFQWMFSKLRNIFQLNFMEPYFLDTKWNFAVGVQNTTADYFNFIRKSRGGNLTWGYELVDNLRVFGTYTLEDVTVSPDATYAGSVPPSFFGGGLTSSAKLTLSYDSRDNRLFPTKGQYHTASVEAAVPGAPLFSENAFTRYSLTSRFYHPLPLGVVLRFKAELGMISGQDFPLSERYFLGGVFSLRGYPLRGIAPAIEFPTSADPLSSTTPFAIGGNKQAVFNLELEFPLLPPVGIRGVLFYDIGNAFADSAAWFVDNEHSLPLGMFHSVGFGIRWFSPIGPLRFEWGIPLTPRPEDQKIRFEFMVGNAF